MTQRLNYAKATPEVFKALSAVNPAILAAGLPEKLMHLVFLRVSQINRCAFCVDLHSNDLRKLGETDGRLDNVIVWEESQLFTEQEKAALLWAEVLTLVADTHAPDEAYAAVRAQFDDTQLANLTYAIANINSWNRIAIGFRKSVAPR